MTGVQTCALPILGAIRNVGFNVVDDIVKARTEKGAFESFHDFLRKIPISSANKRTVESLIKAGAFDEFGDTRRALVEIHEGAVEGAVKVKRDEAHGNVGFDFDSLFAEVAEEQPSSAPVSQVPDRPEWSKRDKLAFERDMLGLYVSDHPLAGLEIELAKHQSITIADLLTADDSIEGETVTVAGLLTSVQHRVAKTSGNPYGIVDIEDFGGQIGVMFLGKTYQEFGPSLVADSIVVLRGRVNVRDDGKALHAVSMFQPNVGDAMGSGPLTLSVPERQATTEIVTELAAVLGRHSGETEVRLKLVKDSVARTFELPMPVNLTPDLFGELKSLLGPRCLV